MRQFGAEQYCLLCNLAELVVRHIERKHGPPPEPLQEDLVGPSQVSGGRQQSQGLSLPELGQLHLCCSHDGPSQQPRACS